MPTHDKLSQTLKIKWKFQKFWSAGKRKVVGKARQEGVREKAQTRTDRAENYGLLTN